LTLSANLNAILASSARAKELIEMMSPLNLTPNETR